jgi:protein-S-isoprenylcysteine O-methyltransferase Ste14
MFELRWIVTAGWVCFALTWLVWSFGAKRSLRTAARTQWLARAVAIGILLWAARDRTFGGQSLLLVGAHPELGVAVSGVVLCLFGIATAIWARLYLGSNWGMPMSVKADPELVTAGPYRFVRNPIYAGILLAMAGSTLVDGLAWLVVFAVSAVYFVYSAKVEEGIMQRAFPDAYPAYKRRTKLLIPFVF